MQLNWCYKGIAENPSFGDLEASGVLSATGILSSWMIANRSATLDQANTDSQNALSASALDDHVNNYWIVAGRPPYISLSAGCVEFAGSTRPAMRYAALRTALDFATDGGRTSGYVFRCWVVTGLKPTPELPGTAEEIRDLNLFSDMYTYHREGEVAAKLFVPRRQVQWVLKIGADAKPANATWTTGGHGRRAFLNQDFVHPDRASNVIKAL
jgi:hypothetical protein